MEKVFNKIRRVFAFFAKENLYNNNYYLKNIINKNHRIFIDYFYNDIIEMVMSMGNINFSKLNSYYQSAYGRNLTKEDIIRNISAYDFLLHPFILLFWWSDSNEGYDFWSKQQKLYSEHIKQIIQLYE